MNFDEFMNVVVIIALVVTLALKGLGIRRYTRLGRSMARFNFILAFVYFCAVLALFIDFFTSMAWRYLARIAVLLSALDVIWQLKVVYGGWCGLWQEIRRSFVDLLPYWIRTPRIAREYCRDFIRRKLRRD